MELMTDRRMKSKFKNRLRGLLDERPSAAIGGSEKEVERVQPEAVQRPTTVRTDPVEEFLRRTQDGD